MCRDVAMAVCAGGGGSRVLTVNHTRRVFIMTGLAKVRLLREDRQCSEDQYQQQ